MRKIRCLI